MRVVCREYRRFIFWFIYVLRDGRRAVGAQPGREACRRTASANIVADYLLYEQLMSASERRTLSVCDALLARLLSAEHHHQQQVPLIPIYLS